MGDMGLFTPTILRMFLPINLTGTELKILVDLTISGAISASAADFSTASNRAVRYGMASNVANHRYICTVFRGLNKKGLLGKVKPPQGNRPPGYYIRLKTKGGTDGK